MTAKAPTTATSETTQNERFMISFHNTVGLQARLAFPLLQLCQIRRHFPIALAS